VVRFVDLYRSGRGDYLQDASVHLVSSVRIPVLDSEARRRIFVNILRFHDFVKQFGTRHQDATLQPRLALALARALITSTRFELRPELARTMFQRAYCLLDAVLDHASRGLEGFTVPLELLDFDSEENPLTGPNTVVIGT